MARYREKLLYLYINVHFFLQLVTVATTVLLASSSAFLLNNNCLATPPCTCNDQSYGYSLRCGHQGLQHVPPFRQGVVHTVTLSVDLIGNSLTVIPDNAFNNLSSINTTEIKLLFRDNHIHTIEPDAFNGIEKVVRYLDLEYNNLTTLSGGVGKLTHLELLFLYGNPLQSFDATTMSKIGRSLDYIRFKMTDFKAWPRETQYLSALSTLLVDSIPFSHLDKNVFHGLEHNLTELHIYYSNLEKVPDSICTLNNLQRLTILGNSLLNENGSSIFEQCSGPMLSVTHIELSYDGLHTFPDVFSLFPSLVSLIMNNNTFEFIDSALIPTNYKVYTINLNSNMLQRIPSALKNFKSLTTIELQSNNIRTVEGNDLNGFFLLAYLDLSHNPLVYISTDAFSSTKKLGTLDLRDTHLDHVPAAVTQLSNLRYLILSGRPISCTCDNSYLKHWDVNAVYTFTTQCASSNQTIKHYVTTTLQSCS